MITVAGESEIYLLSLVQALELKKKNGQRQNSQALPGRASNYIFLGGKKLA